jgi:hypothetical protein
MGNGTLLLLYKFDASPKKSGVRYGEFAFIHGAIGVPEGRTLRRILKRDGMAN